MTLAELDQIENDLRKHEAKFPNGYGTMKALELVNVLRPLVTPKETQTEKETEKGAPSRNP
jgi:hypothetical protein